MKTEYLGRRLPPLMPPSKFEVPKQLWVTDGNVVACITVEFPYGKKITALRFYIVILAQGHANLLCIVPILVYVLPEQYPTMRHPGQRGMTTDTRCFDMACLESMRLRVGFFFALVASGVRPVKNGCGLFADHIFLGNPPCSAHVLVHDDEGWMTRNFFAISFPTHTQPPASSMQRFLSIILRT
ncbi:hypothetical protein AVEN_5346-1 [Araneus ventricosus]|uniref:Uncharacterized protein n=1 Tax=Araneus ventricosus TaxID=182803 RepID=A0A4Y2QC88_ARAVE|nr:hypothetical protein AVEN_5346-1 [Araneus ventricosus]